MMPSPLAARKIEPILKRSSSRSLPDSVLFYGVFGLLWDRWHWGRRTVGSFLSGSRLGFAFYSLGGSPNFFYRPASLL